VVGYDRDGDTVDIDRLVVDPRFFRYASRGWARRGWWAEALRRCGLDPPRRVPIAESVHAVSASIRLRASRASGMSWISAWMRAAERR
jgi:hypothetical protein